MALRTLVHSSTGTFDAVAAGSAVNGTAVFLGQSSKKVAHLSAVVVVDAETDTITLAARWQVSNDKTTWYDVTNGSQNAASVVLATGTGGADAAVTKCIPVTSDSIYGWKFARMSIFVAGTTGTTNDTYTISYSYRQLTGSEGAL